MSWQDFLKPKERADLAKAQSKRDTAREQFNETRRVLKNRAEARMRAEKERNK